MGRFAMAAAQLLLVAVLAAVFVVFAIADGHASAQATNHHRHHRAAGLPSVWTVRTAGYGAMWMSGSEGKTSTTSHTLLAGAALGNAATQLTAGNGTCLGPWDNNGTWQVEVLSATDCANQVPRSWWFQTGDGANTLAKFASVFMENKGVCPGDTPYLTANGDGKVMTSVCLDSLSEAQEFITTG